MSAQESFAQTKMRQWLLIGGVLLVIGLFLAGWQGGWLSTEVHNAASSEQEQQNVLNSLSVTASDTATLSADEKKSLTGSAATSEEPSEGDLRSLTAPE